VGVMLWEPSPTAKRAGEYTRRPSPRQRGLASISPRCWQRPSPFFPRAAGSHQLGNNSRLFSVPSSAGAAPQGMRRATRGKNAASFWIRQTIFPPSVGNAPPCHSLRRGTHRLRRWRPVRWPRRRGATEGIPYRNELPTPSRPGAPGRECHRFEMSKSECNCAQAPLSRSGRDVPQEFLATCSAKHGPVPCPRRSDCLRSLEREFGQGGLRIQRRERGGSRDVGGVSDGDSQWALGTPDDRRCTSVNSRRDVLVRLL